MNAKQFYQGFFQGSHINIDQPSQYYRTADYPNIERYLTILEMVDSLKLPSTARVLDLGAGGGLLSTHLVKRFDTVYAADIGVTSDMFTCLRTCKQILFTEMALPDVPFFSGFFDLVIFSEVIEHLSSSDQEIALTRLSKIITSTGHLVLSTPNPQGM